LIIPITLIIITQPAFSFQLFLEIPIDFQGDMHLRTPQNNADSCDLAEILYDPGIYKRMAR
jgi:hypothetical protein